MLSKEEEQNCKYVKQNTLSVAKQLYLLHLDANKSLVNSKFKAQ